MMLILWFLDRLVKVCSTPHAEPARWNPLFVSPADRENIFVQVAVKQRYYRI